MEMVFVWASLVEYRGVHRFVSGGCGRQTAVENAGLLSRYSAGRHFCPEKDPAVGMGGPDGYDRRGLGLGETAGFQ